ncbi:MAG TPA: SRPBCC family protein [Conexibacter sp.]|nr:SRPBCC family protein [Conexibacter sp.]
MRLSHVHVTHDFRAPVERVFAYLAEHENLAQLFGTRIERMSDGTTERNGVGSCRRLSFWGLLPFEETVTELVRNERIVYRITKGSPMRDHEGLMAFSPTSGGGTRLDYRIQFGSAVPGLAAVVARALHGNIARGLRKLDRDV